MRYMGTIATAIWAGVDIAKGHPAGETLTKPGGAIPGGLAAGQAGGEAGSLNIGVSRCPCVGCTTWPRNNDHNVRAERLGAAEHLDPRCGVVAGAA